MNEESAKIIMTTFDFHYVSYFLYAHILGIENRYERTVANLGLCRSVVKFKIYDSDLSVNRTQLPAMGSHIKNNN